MNFGLENGAFFALLGSRVKESRLFQRLLEGAGEAGPALHVNGAGMLLQAEPPGEQRVYERDGILLLVQGTPRAVSGSGSGPASPATLAADLCSRYRSDPDTFLEGVVGTFRLVLLDETNNRAIAATDRMGTHPVVFLTLADGNMALASDSGLLLEITESRPDLDRSAIYDYLFFHQVPSPRSVFRGLERMLPAHAYHVNAGVLSRKQYWTPAFRAGERKENPGVRSELLPALEKAITAVGPDEKTACFLSGGLDSSTVAGVLARLSDAKTHAFTIGFSEPGYDEMEYARLVARHFDLELHEYYVTPEDVATALPLISGTYDEPFGNSSAVPTYFCATRAREAGFTNLLAGDGGDELFAGNARYAKQKLFEQFFRLPRWTRQTLFSEKLMASVPFRRVWPLRKISRYVEQARQRLPDRLESANPLHYFEHAQVFNEDFLGQVDQSEPYGLMRDWYARAASDHFLNQMLWLDWKFTLTDNDLRKVSVMCRKAGARVHYPMLDQSLIDLSVRIPPGEKLHHYRLRSWYKSAVKGFLPDEILSKKKHGFGLPFGEWLRKKGPMQDMAEASLDRAANLGIFNAGFIPELRRRHKDVHASHYGTLVWVIIMLEQWMSSRKISL